MPSEQDIETVDDRGSPERAKETPEKASESDLREEHDATTPVARDRHAIAEYEPPAFMMPFVGYGRE